MEVRNQDISFFNDVEWVNDLAFLTDVTQPWVSEGFF